MAHVMTLFEVGLCLSVLLMVDLLLFAINRCANSDCIYFLKILADVIDFLEFVCFTYGIVDFPLCFKDHR